jgi:tripartite-type tricarboxylate transporter receptor subunit TctC
MPMCALASSRHRRSLARLGRVLCVLLVTGTATSLRADPIADFYRGRTLNLISGFTPNGEFDSYLRLLGRHIGRYVPGQPQVVSSSRPGAGSMILANHLYNVAAADGTVLGMFAMQVAVEPFLKNNAAVFDPLKFNWIGSLTRDQHFCAVVPGPGIPETFNELLRKEAKEVLFGTSALSSEIYRFTAPLKKLLSARIRLVTGYAGMPAIKLALQRGEVNGVCGLTAAALRRQHDEELRSGRLRLLVQISGPPTVEFGKLPMVFEFARNDEQRELVEFFFRTLTNGRPIAAPPGVPAERLAALRMAFAATLKDEAFLVDAKRLNIDIGPIFDKEIASQLQHVSEKTEAFFQRVREVLQ